MKHFTSSFAATLVLVAAAGAAHGQTKIHLAPIVVGGNTNFDAAAVNAGGMVVGTLYANSAPAGVAIGRSGTATMLPVPAGSWDAFHPRRINGQGDILGWARRTTQISGSDMFLLRRGAAGFDTAYEQPVVEPAGNVSGDDPLPMDLTDKRRVAFNTIVDLSGPVGTSYGRPPNFRHVPAIDRYVHVNSVNDADTVAGIAYSFNGVSEVYTGSGKTIAVLTPPGAVEETGGWINAAGTVAGAFKDGAGAWHGFVYAGGQYTPFDMPEQASSVTVDAINASGRVVGSYAGADGKHHGFLYNGAAVTSFGTFGASDALRLAIGPGGDILLSDQAAGGAFRSYRASCTGSGC